MSHGSQSTLIYKNTGHRLSSKSTFQKAPFYRDKNGISSKNREYDSCKLKAVIHYGPIDSYSAALSITDSDNLLRLYTCLYCSLIFNNPKKFLIHLKWHSFGTGESLLRKLLKLTRNEIAKTKINKKCVKPSKIVKNNETIKSNVEIFNLKGKSRYDPDILPSLKKIDHRVSLDFLLDEKRENALQKPDEEVANETKFSNENFTKGLQCILCTESFKTRNLLKSHIENTHCGNSGDRLSQRCHFKIDCPILINNDNGISYENEIKYNLKWNPKVVLERINLSGCEVFACNICCQIFDTPHQLRKHEKNDCDILDYNPCDDKLSKAEVSSKPVPKCQYCDRTFIWKRSLRKHIKKLHDPKNQPKVGAFKCKLCDQTFQQPKALNMHVTVGHRSSPIECKHCSLKYFNSTALYNHIKLCHSDKMFQCNYCDVKFVTAALRQIHKKKVHQKLECEYCLKPCYNKFQLRTHCLDYHPERFLKCPHCDKMLVGEIFMKIHIEDFHKKKIEFVKCPHCNLEYTRKYILERHIQKKHKKLKTKKCQHCKKLFHEIRHVNRHIRKVHPDKMVACNQCNIVKVDTSELRTHIRMVHQKGKCAICLESYPQRGELLKHYREEHLDVMIKCNLCETTFIKMPDYRKHVKRTHRKASKVKCKICNATFASRCSEKRHLKRKHGKKMK